MLIVKWKIHIISKCKSDNYSDENQQENQRDKSCHAIGDLLFFTKKNFTFEHSIFICIRIDLRSIWKRKEVDEENDIFNFNLYNLNINYTYNVSFMMFHYKDVYII